MYEFFQIFLWLSLHLTFKWPWMTFRRHLGNKLHCKVYFRREMLWCLYFHRKIRCVIYFDNMKKNCHPWDRSSAATQLNFCSNNNRRGYIMFTFWALIINCYHLCKHSRKIYFSERLVFSSHLAENIYSYPCTITIAKQKGALVHLIYLPLKFQFFHCIWRYFIL